MGKNVELKARLDDAHFDEVLAHALKIRTQEPSVLTQTDTFFNVPNERMKLREFADGSAELIVYDRLDQSQPKLSSYIRTPIHEPELLKRSLKRCLGIRGVVKKRRDLVLIGQTRVHLDRVEGLGKFLELEVVLRENQSIESGDEIANQWIVEFGIPPGNLISAAYIDLLEQRKLGA